MVNIGPQRRRRRNAIVKDKREEVAKRVSNFYETCKWDGTKAREHRMQLYAKYRMWTSGTDFPWDNASDVPVPDMFQDSVRTQDTLHNAVMSQKPVIGAKATQRPDEEKEKAVDELIHHQVFTEQCGETAIGEMADSFCNDPAMTLFVPWIRERVPVADVKLFPEIPEDLPPAAYFDQIIQAEFPTHQSEPSGKGWDWKLTDEDDEETAVSFYTDEEDRIEMVTKVTKVVYDGPRIFVKDFDDVIYPSRSANLQMPSASNPGGAPHVTLRDFPTKHEILGHIDSGYYDITDKDDITRIKKATSMLSTESDKETQKQVLSGVSEEETKVEDDLHSRLTRLMCFDKFDIDGDGKAEDVVFWVILETKTLVRARLLMDVCPGTPPRRPLFGGSFMPVTNRYAGISLLESMEGIHDTIKVMVDQSVNSTDLAIASPIFYRPSGGLNPEEYQVMPYSMLPMQNPQQDLNAPQIGNPSAVAQAFNMISMLNGWQDKTTMVTDMSFGQVPSGSSSALRTIGGMSLLQGQGEARPERILRRFFVVLTDVWRHIHRLNQSFLPKNKQFRITGAVAQGQDPYMDIPSKDALSGDFQFKFSANVFNTSKKALQESLMNLANTFISEIALQTGVVTPDDIYRMFHDLANAHGQDADRYLTAPSPRIKGPQLLAEEAITLILRDQLPVGEPLEDGGYREHLESLSKVLGMLQKAEVILTPGQQQLLNAYGSTVKQGAEREAQEQQSQQAAAKFQQGGQGQPGAPVTNPQAPNNQPPPISGANELIDETLPGAGGGANQGP